MSYGATLEFDAAKRLFDYGQHRFFVSVVSVRSWCAIRKISLSFCVLRRTLVSIGVPFLIARGALCGVLACFAGCLLGSIPPASIT
jgi:hypothetical protein